MVWTGPTASPPGNNVSAPINVGTASQIKDGVIGVDGLAVFGTTYIQTKLGINDDTPVVAVDVAGTARWAMASKPQRGCIPNVELSHYAVVPRNVQDEIISSRNSDLPTLSC